MEQNNTACIFVHYALHFDCLSYKCTKSHNIKEQKESRKSITTCKFGITIIKMLDMTKNYGYYGHN